MKPVRVGDTTTRGIYGVQWLLSDDELANHTEQEASNVVSFKEKF